MKIKAMLTVTFAWIYVLCLSVNADAQTGNVGIGTSSPTEKLEINNGNILVNSGGGTPGSFSIKCNTYASEQGTPLLQNQGNLRLLVSSSINNRGIDFARGGSVDMVIDNNGNVGIGTTAPSAKLAVWNGNISVSNGGVYSNTGYWGDVLRTNWGNDLLLQSSYADKGILFKTQTGEKMRIMANGNVGIGTLTPSALLDVNGGINATGGNSAQWNTAYGWGNHAGLYKSLTWFPSWIEITGKPLFATVALSGDYNDLTNQPVNISTFFNDAGYLTGFTELDPKIGANTEGFSPTWNGTALVTGAIFQDVSGNIGINNITPAYKLDVSGGVNLTGQIRIQGGSPGLNKILTSDESGLAAWANIPVRSAALITKEDFSGSPLKNYWSTQITGGAAITISNSAAILSTNGSNSAKLYSTKQKSVTEGILVFKAVAQTYEDNNTAYGPLVRGLVNGTNRNNAIEFINISGNTIQARTVSGGVATTTNYAVGASVNNFYSYSIIASATKAEFYVDGTLIATHTTNIPTAALNMYFDVSSPIGNVPHYVDDASFEIIK